MVAKNVDGSWSLSLHRADLFGRDDLEKAVGACLGQRGDRRPADHASARARRGNSFLPERVLSPAPERRRARLEGVRAAMLTQIPLMQVSIGGAVFGRWVITELDDERSFFDASGRTQR